MRKQSTQQLPMAAPTHPRPTQRIALLMDMDLGCCRSLIRGIHAYSLEKHDWVLRNSPCDPEVISFLRDWRPDGVIATVFDRDIGRALVRLRRPVVDTAYTIRGLKLPVVDVDHVAVGRLAAEHLLEHGYTQFGFVGSRSACYSEARATSYAERLAASGYSVSHCLVEYLYEDFATSSWKKDEPQIQQWVRQLPKPVGVFACNDIAGRGLVEICRQQRLRVPEDVAILGADDDELESRLTVPPLSSIAIPARRVGYEAAKTLDRMMAGEPTKENLFLPPVRVIARQSTDTRATDDPIVAQALQYIRNHASQNIGVNAIAEAMGLGRRDLERRFRKSLNCSVLDDIRSVRVQRVRELLAETSLSMAAIAVRSGFSSPERMTVVFGQVAGMSPTAYRRRISSQNG